MNEVNLANTPGYYYSIAYWIAVCLYSHFLERKYSGLVTWAIRIGGLLLLLSFMIVTKGVAQLLFILTMLAVVLFLYALFRLTCNADRYKCAYVCVRAFVLGEFVASFEWQIYYFLMERWPQLEETAWNICIMAALYAAIFLIIFLLEKRTDKEDYEIQIGCREFLTVAVIALVIYFISNVSYLYTNTPFSSSFSREVFIIRTLVDLGGMAVIYAYHLQLIQTQFFYESQYLRQMISMQYTNYQISEKSIELVNQKYHDLKHQIAILRENALDNDSVVQSIDAMEQEIKSYEAQNRTGNKVLDTILTSKSLYGQEFGIQINPVVDGAALDFIDVMDLSALFGNILDNAIEGCMKVQDREKRLIHLTVVQQKDFLWIRSENYFDGRAVFDKGVIRTTKSNRGYHGFGMKSIRSIAQKYGGSATFQVKDHWFEVRILIPIPK